MSNTLQFASEDASSSFRLFELPEHLLQLILQHQHDQPWFIKFVPQIQQMVFCSSDKTYSIQKIETSNLLLLIEQQQHIIGTVSNHFELQEFQTKPYCIPAIRKLLQYSILDSTTLLFSNSVSEKTRPLQRISKQQCMEQIPCSVMELELFLKELQVIEWEGYLYLIDKKWISQLFDLIMNYLYFHKQITLEIPMDEYLCKEFPHIARELFVKIVQLFFCEEGKLDQHSKIQLISVEKMLQVEMMRCFDKQKSWTVNELMILLHQSLRRIQGNLSLTREDLSKIIPVGQVIFTRNVLAEKLEEVVIKIDRYELSTDLKQRFQELFQQKLRWTMEEITPFLIEFTTATQTVEKLVTKFAKISSQQGYKIITQK